jgi:ABC-type dipeptide/oligopeptide/nickel transport system permease component
LLNYLFKRSLHAVLAAFIASILVFSLLQLIPGDPIRVMATPATKQADIERLRAKWGLDQPLPLQYMRWLGRTIQGDLGDSVRMRVPVSEVLWPRYVNTLRLTVLSMLIAVIVGVSVGVAASISRGGKFDTVTMIVAVSGFSIPPFWLGLILILVFSVQLGWFPAGNGDSWRHIILPAISLGVASMALIARLTRSTMLEVLNADYIRTARAKGLGERRIMLLHALKNASIPIVTIIGLQFGVLMAGAVVTEIIFTWPGIGWLLVNGILNRDFPVVQASLLVVSITFITVNLIVDIIYMLLDPRVRFEN